MLNDLRKLIFGFANMKTCDYCHKFHDALHLGVFAKRTICVDCSVHILNFLVTANSEPESRGQLLTLWTVPP